MFHLFFKQNYNTVTTTYGTGGKSGNESSFNASNGRHVIKIIKNLVYYDNELVISYSSIDFSLSQTMLIFTNRDYQLGVVDNRAASFKLYFFQIYNNNTLIRDYIPVIDQTNRPCLFDKVEKKCYYNQGSGEFLYG